MLFKHTERMYRLFDNFDHACINTSEKYLSAEYEESSVCVDVEKAVFKAEEELAVTGEKTEARVFFTDLKNRYNKFEI